MQIRINGYTFELTSPYAEGSVLTSGEAKAFNNLRAENIQNNFRSKVNEAVSGLPTGELLSASALAELQAGLSAYDLAYKFNEKQARSRVGDIEAEARAIARERTLAQAAQDGLTLTEAILAQVVSEMEKIPSVLDEARLRVQAKRSALSAGMESL